MGHREKRAVLVVGVVLLGAVTTCRTPSGPPRWDGPTLSQTRDQLTVQELVSGEMPELVDLSYLAKPAWSESGALPFEGSLALSASALLLDFPNRRELYAGEDLFPEVTLDFVSDGGLLVPLNRRLIATGAYSESQWDILVGAGAVWKEPRDDDMGEDWSRASFPLNLVDRYFNQVRNCVATFVYQAEQVSDVYVQCSQETADLRDQQVGNIQAMVPATYTPSAFPESADVLQAHARAIDRRIPTRPLREWDVDGELAESFDTTITTSASTSVGAIYSDGVLYVHPPMTRHGPYPYPDEMRHGVYSVSKSLAGSLAMFYFAKRYGEDIFGALVSDYVPAFADLSEWDNVTFGDTLNMATGTRGGEEAALLYEPVVLADSAEAAIANIAGFGDAPAAPGEVFAYATTHTFVLSYALQKYVDEQEGPGVQYWDLVRQDVLEPIGAGNFDVLMTRDPDPADRIPTLGFGARPTLDEATKVAVLMSNEGLHDGEQLLHAQTVRQALGRDEGKGLRVDRSTRYRHSFWNRDVHIPRSSGCGTACIAHAATMQGYGGNYIALLESGVILLRFMDEFDEDIEDLVVRTERIEPSCN